MQSPKDVQRWDTVVAKECPNPLPASRFRFPNFKNRNNNKTIISRRAHHCSAQGLTASTFTFLSEKINPEGCLSLQKNTARNVPALSLSFFLFLSFTISLFLYLSLSPSQLFVTQHLSQELTSNPNFPHLWTGVLEAFCVPVT